MASIACITHNEEVLSLEIASQHFLHERTKTSNRLRRDGEMTIAILRMPISIKLTFGQQGCSGLFCNHNRHCRLFIVPVRPVRPPAHGPLEDPGEQPSRTLALKRRFVYDFRHQSRLEWSRNPRSFRFPPWQGLRRDRGGCGSISDLSQSSGAQAEPDRQGYRCRRARRHTSNL